MRAPILALFRLNSEGLGDLRETISVLKTAMRDVKRRKIWRPVESMFGMIEPKLTDRLNRFNVHFHAVLDAVSSFDEQEMATVFGQLTGGRGYFSIDGPVRNRKALARYLCKTDSLSPDPALLDKWHFIALKRGLRGKHLQLLWERRAAT